jgi:hypothetical protein
MDAWPRNFTLIVKERTKQNGGIKKQGWMGDLIPEYLTKEIFQIWMHKLGKLADLGEGWIK